MTKRIVMIRPNGTEIAYTPQSFKGGLPSLKQMQEMVGGYIELVRVLREDLPGFAYTYMVVNEEGLLDKLPENPRATAIYLANVRRQFPDSAEPWKVASEKARAMYEARGFSYHDITPAEYKDKPPVVVGTAIWFQGYTCDELHAMGF